VLRFLDGVRRRDPEVSAPVYSHVTYDVMPGERLPAGRPEVLVLEGVNALQFADRLDVAVYLHAAEDHMESWYVDRFVELCASPPAGSFYVQFAEMTVDEQRSVAGDVWRGVNLVNLRECIKPTRISAHVVVEKRADHSVARIDVVNVDR
jgi:type I pantothenate kinase